MFRLGAISSSEAETGRFGALVAGVLRPGDLVRLMGELGSGKTTLVRAIAAGLGADPRLVSSPTFTVIHEYEAGGGLTILHADAYRMDPEDDLERDRLGWDEASSGRTVALVEWGERLPLPGESATITLSHAGETARAIELLVPASWGLRPGWSALTAWCARHPG